MKMYNFSSHTWATLAWWYGQHGITEYMNFYKDKIRLDTETTHTNDSIEDDCSHNNINTVNMHDRLEKLAFLRRKMLAFEDCDLKQYAENMVFSDGCINSHIMLVGEAPGAEEDREGKPFVGMSGQLLDMMMYAIGLVRSTDFYIVNVVPWRPPFNRKPTHIEIQTCLPFLEEHIAIMSPKVLICVGSVAYETLIGRFLEKKMPTITQAQGQHFAYKNPHLNHTILTIPIYHPSYLLRSPQKKRTMWHTLIGIKKTLDTLKDNLV